MRRQTTTILVCDDDEPTAELYGSILGEAGWENVLVRTDPRSIMPLLRETEVGVILLDLNMPVISGRELLEQIGAEFPAIAVIVLTQEDSVDVAVECMKVGAFDFMSKPVDPNKLINAVGLAQQMRGLKQQVEILSARRGEVSLQQPEAFARIVTKSAAMYRLFEYVEAIAPSPNAALITGDSGTGKELIARAIHETSGRTGRFLAVNVSGLDDTMFSDTLFGHLKGAYTGADGVRAGMIEQAADGTLFLDEIGDLPMSSQVKLLRLLQEQEYYPLGADVPVASSARIVTATNTELDERRKSGEFRKDLYYRLMTHHIHLPPLRERSEDIPLLIAHFAAASASELGREAPEVPPEFYAALRGYSFPGNVRELQALVADAVSRSTEGELSPESVQTYIERQRDGGESDVGRARISYSGPFPTLKETEEYLISIALERSGGNQTAAAAMLGVSQSTLSRRLAGERAAE